jgi:plastocyanin
MFAVVPAYAGEEGPGKRYVATIGEDGYQHVEMTAGGYYFDPRTVVVKVNVPVELTIRREPGITPHNLVMRSPEADLEFEIDITTEPKKVTFMATRTGAYPFECSKRFLFFKSHKDRGMHGVLEVVE